MHHHQLRGSKIPQAEAVLGETWQLLGVRALLTRLKISMEQNILERNHATFRTYRIIQLEADESSDTVMGQAKEERREGNGE